MAVSEKEGQMMKDASGSFKSLAEAHKGGGLSSIADFVFGIAEMALALEKAMIEMKKASVAATDFAIKLADIDFKHATFGIDFNIKFQEMENQYQQLQIQKKRMDLQEEQLDLGIEQAELGIQQAKLGVSKAALEAYKASYAMREAALHIRQAANGVQQAIFGYRQAMIASEMADLEYSNKLFDIKSNLLKSKKAAIEAEKNYKDELAKLYEPWINLDDAASKYVNSLGGGITAMKNIKNDALAVANGQHTQSKYNVSAEEMIKVAMKYNQELGRNTRLTQTQLKNLSAIYAVYQDENTVKLATALDHFGYDFNKSSKFAGKMFANASAKGIALGKASKTFLDNIKMVESYNFAGGVRGFERMAEKAAAINLNMSEIGKASDKMSTLKGAAEAAIQLANLGDDFAQFANPLALLKESTINMEGLQDTIVSMFGELAQWDGKKGEISMTAENRYKMKTASQAMGMDPKAISDMVFNQARRNQLSPQVDRLGVSDTIKELLMNTAQLNEKGDGYVNIGGKEMSLDKAAQMDPNKLEAALRELSQSDSENICDIAEMLRSIKDTSDGWDKSLHDSMSQKMEESGIGEIYKKDVIKQTEDGKTHADLTAQILDIGTQDAQLNKEMAKWKQKYAENAYRYQVQTAELERDRAKWGPKQAQAQLDSQMINEEKAYVIEPWQARITKKEADLGKWNANIAYSSATINQRAKDIDVEQYALDKQKYETEKQKLSLENKNIIFQYVKERQRDELYATTRDIARSEKYIALAEMALAHAKSAVKSMLELDFGGIIEGVSDLAADVTQLNDTLEAEKLMQQKMRSLLMVWDDTEGLKGMISGFKQDLDNDATNKALASGTYHMTTYQEFVKSNEMAADATYVATKNLPQNISLAAKNFSGGNTDNLIPYGSRRYLGKGFFGRDIIGYNEENIDQVRDLFHLAYPDNYPFPVIQNGLFKGLIALQGGEAIIPVGATRHNKELIRKIINNGARPLGNTNIGSDDVDEPSEWQDWDYNEASLTTGYITINLDGTLFNISTTELAEYLQKSGQFKESIAKAVGEDEE